MGARRNFSRGGQNRVDRQKLPIFRRAEDANENFRFFRHFRLNLRVFDGENYRVFSTGAAYDVIIFKFQGRGQLPQVAPLRAPMRSGVVHDNVDYTSYTCIKYLS